MTRKLLRDISASSIQVVLNQVLGVIIFFITSRYLDKAAFGEINWSLALLTFITSILSLRLEQIVVRRVAMGQDPSKLLTLFTGHILVTGICFYLILLTGRFLFPGFFREHDLLLILAVSHLLSFFSSPFKQLATGKENFRFLAIMSSVANLIRAVWLLIAVLFSSVTVEVILSIFIVSSFIELMISYYLSRYKLKVSLSTRHRLADYFLLIRESLPLVGTVFLNASIARIDWILLGLFTTQEKTAEYSFAFRVLELSPLPLLIVAPILLSRLSRFFGSHTLADLLQKKKELSLLIRTEMILATLIPLALNLVWSPLIDAITSNKYGSVNSSTFLILSCCLPFLYMNNLFWSVHFALDHLKLILKITLLTFIIILAGDLLFIPRYAAQGAAVVYLLATVAEYFNYLRASTLFTIRDTWISPIACIASAAASGLLAVYLTESAFFRLAIGLPVFFSLLLATKQLRKSDWTDMLRFSRERN
ncbi:MAG: oligosaccharide flippase family protein [Chitinophagaceae bacterium]|nr:oligosaccharide flippase family protein [Chitinophagaceae bacterium]